LAQAFGSSLAVLPALAVPLNCMADGPVSVVPLVEDNGDGSVLVELCAAAGPDLTRAEAPVAPMAAAAATAVLPPMSAPSAAGDDGDDAGDVDYAAMPPEPGMPLMGADARDEDGLALWRWIWLGRILVWRVPCGVIYIGPHWYCSVIMLSFIIGVGYIYIVGVGLVRGFCHFLGGTTVTMLSVATFLRCALADPGVVRRQSQDCEASRESGDSAAEVLRPDESGTSRRMKLGRHCSKCNVPQPWGVVHCDFCQVCIEGHDHHCPWMGKCIGRNNLCAFYTFICVSMSSLGYIFVATVLTAPAGGGIKGTHGAPSG